MESPSLNVFIQPYSEPRGLNVGLSPSCTSILCVFKQPSSLFTYVIGTRNLYVHELIDIVFMPPTLIKLKGHIALGCPSVPAPDRYKFKIGF